MLVWQVPAILEVSLCITLDLVLLGFLYINPDTNPVSIAVTTNRILRVDVAPNETTFFESNYPVVLTSTDSLGVEVGAPDAGGVGIGSAVNFLVNGDTDIS